ncbi:hypothetical protein ACQQ2Q_08750 [Agrobacterium sp. ES01]|uniref:hypothetical protein n=1 Tax=Agrobacterium sp. ES01 TaxID=3420714 RepID=UPI003D0AF704
MAYITAPRSVAAAPFHPPVGRLLARALALLYTYRCWQARRRAENALASLPFSVRKDIGWPAADRAKISAR